MAAKRFESFGQCSPLGARVLRSGVNFSIYSHSASAVELLLFDREEDDARPARVVRLDPATNRTYHYWHAFLPGVSSGQIYGSRVEGPFERRRGRDLIQLRFSLILNGVA